MMKTPAMLILLILAPCGQARAQSSSESAGAASMEAGYGRAGSVASRTFNPVTRDANGNRLVVNGVIMNGQPNAPVNYSSAGSDTLSGAAYFDSGAAALNDSNTSTAVGNLVNVSIIGHGNTVVLNSSQTNNGDITANSRKPGS
ncbi:holdfast attachment protein HfaA [Brevundimonas vesicularis]|uniref:holdfast anchoring protein HfaA n=1 Tax=Brevundimonas vesicularis TaxID=41276 RepID=UPI0018ECD816|nr:holdfast anchoring protein HfaA [Brevundimonas vesicularis]MDQ1193833.1 holdfast attachment protein HfaA [Brevundimonas vesicularis]